MAAVWRRGHGIEGGVDEKRDESGVAESSRGVAPLSGVGDEMKGWRTHERVESGVGRAEGRRRGLWEEGMERYCDTEGFLLETAMPLFEPRTLMKETAASIQMKTFGSDAIII